MYNMHCMYSIISCIFYYKWKQKLLSFVQFFGTPWANTVHEIVQVRILEWVAFPFSRGSFQSRDQTQVSYITGQFFTIWATREAQDYWSGQPIPSPVDLPEPGIEPGLQHYRQSLNQMSYQGSPIL